MRYAKRQLFFILTALLEASRRVGSFLYDLLAIPATAIAQYIIIGRSAPNFTEQPLETIYIAEE